MLLSLLLIAALLLAFDTSSVLSRLASIQPAAIVVALGLFMTGQWLNALRWRCLLLPVAPAVPATSVFFRLFMIGSFFSVFLPSSVGGDVVRAEMSQKLVGGRIPAYATILASRLMGLLATLFVGSMALAGATLMYSVERDATIAWLACFGLLGGAGAAFAWSDLSVFVRARERSQRLLLRLSPELARFIVALAGRKRLLGGVFAISVAIIAIAMVGTVAALSTGLDIEAPMYIHWIAVPAALIATLAPVSFNGAGVRELVFVLLYGKVGVDPASATALGLAFTSLITLVGLAGGGLLLLPARDSLGRP